MASQDERTLSRRDLLRLGTLGATACAIGCGPKAETPTQPTAQAPAQPPPTWTVDLGIQSYSLRAFGFEEAIAKTHEVGLHFIEFFPRHFPQNMNAQELAARQGKLAALDIQPNAYGVCGLGNNEQAVRALFGFCKKAGIDTVAANPAPDALDLLDKLVAEYSIKVAIHNHGPHDKRWGKLKQLLDGTESHDLRIGVCLDTGHLVRAGDDPIEAVTKLGPRLHGLHFKDVCKDSTHDCVVGQGRTDLVAFFTAVKEVGFAGAFSLEFEIDHRNPLPGIAASLAAMRQAIAKVG